VGTYGFMAKGLTSSIFTIGYGHNLLKTSEADILLDGSNYNINYIAVIQVTDICNYVSLYCKYDIY
jgi:hypothetical protein